MTIVNTLHDSRPLELIIPSPRLSKSTESVLSRYRSSVADVVGDRQVVRFERLPAEEFCFEAAQASLSTYYGMHERSGVNAGQIIQHFGHNGMSKPAEKHMVARVLDLPRPVVCALGPLVAYLQRFGLDRALARPHLVSFSQSHFMTLDAVTLRDLEVLQCQSDGREAGSLFSILNRTRTAFGKRVLSGWIRQPLLSVQDIVARQDAVEELATDPPPFVERLRNVFRDLTGLEPAIASLHHRRVQPSRFLALLRTMQKVFTVFHPPDENDAGNASDEYSAGNKPESVVLRQMLTGVSREMGPIINRFLQELDQDAATADDYVRALAHGESLNKQVAVAAGKEKAALEGLEKELHFVRAVVRKPSLQWKTLRTGMTTTVEYLVELKKSEAKNLAPDTWMKVSQTKDLSRFHTPHTLRLQQELLRARESHDIAARQAWTELVVQADNALYEDFRNAVQALGTLDALLSMAAVAKLPGYVRPSYSPQREKRRDTSSTRTAEDKDAIVLAGARHPTVERVLEGTFVPNDVELRKGECMVVTGPNMGGKSSIVRMVALICIMGQMGSFVPADSAELYPLDGVYTRMGAGDDLAADMSTFMVELWHTSYILQQATARSLIILDELGRGTSTYDGVAIALATLHHIVRDLRCALLFVTHYPQVAGLASDTSLSGIVKNAHMSFIENDEEGGREHDQANFNANVTPATRVERRNRARVQGVTFLYQLVMGQAYRSYGLNVARAAGMDEDMIDLAAQKSAEMREGPETGAG